MTEVLQLLACYGLVFFLADSHLTVEIREKIDSWLYPFKGISDKYKQLTSCYFCMGTHAGWVSYCMRCFLVEPPASFGAFVGGFLSWSFASATFCYILNLIVEWFEDD